MKKIGLAVCYDTKNFGSQLQVLATVRIIEKLGYESEIIQYKKKISPIFVMQTIPRLFNTSFVKSKLSSVKKNREIQNHRDIAKRVAIRNERFDGFINVFFGKQLRVYSGWENLVKESSTRYDAFLCGSDQLWLPNNLGSHFYTLEFAPENKPKIAYATSFGVSSIPNKSKAGFRKFLKRFQALSTREIEGQRIIKKLIGKNAQVVCDPTLLFDADEWCEIIPDCCIIDEPYIFCYLLGTNVEHRRVAQEFKKKTGLTLVTCPFLDNFVEEDIEFGDKQMYDIDSADFVNLVRHAEYILTDSFHGSVFSILYHKKFCVFDRFKAGINSRNSRIDSLCGLLDLSSRRYSGEIMVLEQDVDYMSADSKLQVLRKDSISYLEWALKI